MSKIRTKKVVFFMIPIPKFILKICFRPIRYMKFKEIHHVFLDFSFFWGSVVRQKYVDWVLVGHRF